MGRNATKQIGVSWAYYILPHIEEQAIYDSYDDTKRVGRRQEREDDADADRRLRLPEPSQRDRRSQFRRQ